MDWIILIAAGFGAHMDVLTDHSKIDLASANAYVGAAVAIYVLGLWAIRDHFAALGVVALSCQFRA